MARKKAPKPRPALTDTVLRELALAYVGRFATTRFKLASYLQRKLRERGWDGDRQPDVEAIVERIAELGYVDDAAYAQSKARALAGRGYGARRVRQTLRAAGIAEEDSVEAEAFVEAEAVEAALRFARRRRLGPFADRAHDRPERERALAAMIRAGHSFEISRKILSLKPSEMCDIDGLVARLC
jgi:regulatory protein